MSKIEKRSFEATVELRAEEGKPTQLNGLVKVNVRSVDLGGFREVLMPGVFDNILDNDVRGLKNHDENLILGRTKSGTLRMKLDKEGNLGYEIDLPNTTVGRDIQEEVKRGDIDGTSFAFRVAPDGVNWREEEDGTVLREVTKFSMMRDLSPVTYPAYPDDNVSLRSEFDEYKKSKEKPKPDDSPDDDLGTYKERTRLLEIETAL